MTGSDRDFNPTPGRPLCAIWSGEAINRRTSAPAERIESVFFANAGWVSCLFFLFYFFLCLIIFLFVCVFSVILFFFLICFVIVIDDFLLFCGICLYVRFESWYIFFSFFYLFAGNVDYFSPCWSSLLFIYVFYSLFITTIITRRILFYICVFLIGYVHISILRMIKIFYLCI